MELLEYISGARMHVCLYAPNQTLAHVITDEFIAKLLVFNRNVSKTFTEIYISLYNNKA